jgi:hypothetical protein
MSPNFEVRGAKRGCLSTNDSYLKTVKKHLITIYEI